jgi:hypothetical protein
VLRARGVQTDVHELEKKGVPAVLQDARHCARGSWRYKDAC